VWSWDDGVPDNEGGSGHNRRFGFVWYPAMREIFIEMDRIKTNKKGNGLVLVLEELSSIKDGTTSLPLMLVVMELVIMMVEG
jgi:hypothetical protein